MIQSAGLSPAWQQILTFDQLAIGDVNRAAAATACASGKVLNVGRAIASLGSAGHTLATVGGLAGQAIRDQFAVDEIAATWIETTSATRVCTTIVEIRPPSRLSVGPRITELVENALPITLDELDKFEVEFNRLVEAADVVVLTGSLPPVGGHGPPTDLYRRCVESQSRTILDGRGPELRAALSARPLLVKPNRFELSATVGRSLESDADVVAAMREVMALGARWVLVTDGPRPALLSDGTNVWRCTPPSREVVNPIGCGDCLAAGVAVALGDGADMIDAVRFGMAASLENLGHLLPARLSLEAVRTTMHDVEIARESM